MLIDQVYLADPSLPSSYFTCPPLGNSDHSWILLSLNWPKCPPQKIRPLIWNYSRADWNTICNEHDNLPSPSDDTDSSWAAWKSHFQYFSWITPDLLKLFHKCDLAFRRFVINRTDCLWSEYCSLHNRSVSGVWNAKFDFLKNLSANLWSANLQSANLWSPKQFWSLYHSLSPNRQRISTVLTEGTTSAESTISKANLLALHFWSPCHSNL